MTNFTVDELRRAAMALETIEQFGQQSVLNARLAAARRAMTQRKSDPETIQWCLVKLLGANGGDAYDATAYMRDIFSNGEERRVYDALLRYAGELLDTTPSNQPNQSVRLVAAVEGVK